MTLSTLSPATATWSRVGAGLHAGNRDGTFVGCIERTERDTYLAFDSITRFVGEYPDFSAAAAALDAALPRLRPGAAPTLDAA